MTLEEIQKEKKSIQRKINGLKNRMYGLVLAEKILESPLKVDDIVEVLTRDGWYPVTLTKPFIYSLEKPDFGFEYKHLTKKGKNADQDGMFYVSKWSSSYRVPPKVEDVISKVE